MQSQAGFSSALLLIATDASLPITDHVRQSAVVQLKNILRRSESHDEITIPEEDDKFLSENIFLYMIKSNIKQVHLQLEECIMYIVSRKTPKGWPIIFEQITTTLTTANDPKSLHTALTAAHCLSKKYKYEIGEERKLFDVIVSNLYGLLYEVAVKLVVNPGEQAAGFLKLIAKAFACNAYIDISILLTKEDVFAKWMQLFQKMLEWGVDPALEVPTEDEEVIKERKKSEILKMRKAVSKVFYYIFHKYGESKLVASTYKEFSQNVEKNYDSGIIKINIQILQASQTKFVLPSILSLAFKTIKEAVKNNHFKAEIRKGLPELLQNCAFPKLLMSPKDARLWNEDPLGYVKLLLDEDILDDYDPRSVAMEFINIACSESSYYNEDKDSYHPLLGEFLTFLTTVFDKSLKENNARAFDAALFAIGCLEEEIEKYDVLVSNIEPVIKQYILPNLKNALGIIRMRCAWVYSKFAAIEFKDEQSLSTAFQILTKALREEEPPVKCMSALAIANLINKEPLAAQLRPYVAEIITIYLGMVRETELERLVEALNNIIKVFSQEIKPYAIELIKEILRAYNKMFENIKYEEGNDESEMASSACLDTIGTIIEVIEKDQTTLHKAEALLISTILRSFTPDRLVDMDRAVDLLAKLSYYTKKTTPALWELFPLIINMTVGMPEEVAERENVKQEGSWAFENLKDLLLVLQNTVTRDPDTFIKGYCSRGTYVELMFMLINRILEISKYKKEEIHSILAIKLIMTLLETFKVIVSVIN